MQSSKQRNQFPGGRIRFAWPILWTALALSPTTGAQTLSPAILLGKLVTSGSGSPVANATVEWSIVGQGAGPANTTDANGNFAFEIPLAAPTQVEISTNANLYNPVQTYVQMQPGVNMQITLKLVHKPSAQIGAVAGIVRNTAGLVIPNAKVTILGAGGLLTTTTNSTGHYQLTGVGFNANLQLQASTATPPCIVPTTIPLSMTSTPVIAPVVAAPVLTLTVNCPPATTLPAGAAETALRPLTGIDDTVQWQQADSLSIASPTNPTAWNAGRVNDILRFPPGQGFLVASDDGGVWNIAEDATRTATPLSNAWPSITMSSLAQGTGGPQDIYAGTFPYGNSPGGLLWETDTSQPLPLNSWDPIGTPCSQINKILVISEANLILMACDTGLWWSSIPPAPSVKGSYNWKQAQPSSVGGKAFSGLAKGPGWSVTGTIGTIVASRWTAPNTALIFTAKWTGSALNLKLATVPTAGKFSRTSVAACASNPQIMYAVASDSGGQGLSAIWQSTNAGVNWTAVTLPSNPGLQGDSNQAVAISPDCSTVAVGWQTGTFVSFNAGTSWTMLTDTAGYNNLHVDIHALQFDPVVPGVLFIGSSGGVASTAGLTNGSTPTFESDWNTHLFNLEFFDGGGSSSFDGFVGAASQDNGVLNAALPGPWQHADNCGGMLECWGFQTIFGEQNQYSNTNTDLFLSQDVLYPVSSLAQSITVNSPVIPFNGAPDLNINLPCSPCDKYNLNVVAPVRDALTVDGSACNVSNATGQCMFAVSEMFVFPTGDGVYGLFGNLDMTTGMHWELLNSGPALWADVTAIAASYDGNSIFIGNDIGNMWRLDSPAACPVQPSTVWCVTQFPVAVPASCLGFCPVTGLYAFNRNLAYAAYGAHFMQFAGISWVELGQADLPHDREFLSLVATDPSRIYLASSAGVFDTTNGGANWMNASVGLPALIPGVPGFQPPSFYGSHDYLQLVSAQGDTRLYLESFGRSLWRTFMPLPAPPPARTFSNITVEILTGNDDARSNSEIQATVISPVSSAQTSFCLKPSTTTDPSPNNVCVNGPGQTDQMGNQTWPNGIDVKQTFTFSPSMVLDGATLSITLVQHYSSPDQSDNWDIQAIEVTAMDGSGTLGLATMSNGPYISGDNNCMARLKDTPNPSSVAYGLSANDPSGFNIVHPISAFGPTPPGACPQ